MSFSNLRVTLSCRFGPGMVIYWFGHVDDIEDNSDKGILVKTDLPENVVRLNAETKLE